VFRGPEPAGIARIAVGSVVRARRLSSSAHAAAAEPELEMAGLDSRGAPLVDHPLVSTRPQAAPSRIGQSRASASGAGDSGRGLLDVQERTGSGSTPTATMRSPSRDRPFKVIKRGQGNLKVLRGALGAVS
jgi:hypothetical protein